ncbi:hypothetical protein [Acetobacter pasteurianus]|uniref:Uncharacterized protein n=1 Tax=Acetobacter pasteurianus NBRC 3188 TaxID=1226663 RepID=A0A401WWE2_ACEPA|nr:hypothetical protein [Acetobacter pasteurianus]GCD53594.1 hypothetical protein NBRC3188_2291 [Acetobacter pasteurianus NBRC 3188]
MNDQSEGKYIIGNVSFDDKIVGFWGEDCADGRYLPSRFNSEAEAQAAISECVAETEQAYKDGYMSSPSSADDFKALDSTDPIITAMILETFPDLAQEGPGASPEDQPSP